MDDEKKELMANENSKALTIEDLKEYSKALDFYDKGNKSEAKKIGEKLINKYPDFQPLNNLLKKV